TLATLERRTGARAQVAATPTTSSLVFDPATYTEKTQTIATAAGDVEVIYRFYEAIPYVANPVDVAYQSLNISVPVEIAGVTHDAYRAPIRFQTTIGGYLSSSVTGGETAGGAPGGFAAGTPGAGGPGGPSDNGTPMAGDGPPDGGMTGGGQAASNSDLALAAG